MSKKSRRRNKRLLMLAALAGGAALAGRNKRIRATDSPGNEFAKARAAMTDLPDYNPPKAVTGVIKPTAPVDSAAAAEGSSFQTPFKRKVDGKWRGPNEIRMLKAKTAGNLVPPSMRGGALHAEGYQRKIPGQRHYPGGWEGGYSMRAKGGRIGAKKGGRVTGIAKRGFGRALMKGKK